MKLLDLSGQKFGRLTVLKISKRDKHHTYWLHDFTMFYNWAMENGYRDDLTIDRIDTNSNYNSSNCRWVDRKTQNRNTRHNRNITINNETHCLKEWCEILNLKSGTVYARLKHGWDIKKALNYGKVSD